MNQVGELRELKRLISVEMSTLRRKAEMRQLADQELSADLTRRIASLELSLERAEQEASIDPLTQVANRGSIERTLPRLIEEARRANRPLSLAMVDLDHFKRINDTFGHLVGDRVLLFTAQMLLKGVRESDFVARYGGEEFVVALPGANLAQSVTRLDALVRQIADDAYQYTADSEARTLRFTVSCGVAELIPDDTMTSLVARADEALLEAKRRGRNRVQINKPRAGLFSRVFARTGAAER